MWDGFWVLSFLWLAPVALILTHGEAAPWQGRLDGVYFALSIGFWIGHRVSSTWMAYFTSAYRPLLETQRTRFVWVPLGILVAVFAILLPPDDALPWTRTERVIGLTILDVLLVTYHFAAQHYGLLSLYRVRAGQTRSRAARRIDRLYALVVGGLLVLLAEIVSGMVAFQDLWIDTWIDPTWVAGIQETARTVLGSLVGVGALALVVLELKTRRPSVPRLLYAIGLAGMVYAALYLHFFVFLVLWTAQHWLAATGLASLAIRDEPDPGPSRWYRVWHVVNRRAWAVVVVLIVISVVLTPLMEVEALGEGDDRYGDRLFPFAASWWREPGLWHVFVALGLVTAFVHYALDRAVWRFSDPEVRRAASGLLRTPSGG